MTSKKNRFFTFCFSLLPGAGEMYLGFMKMGLSLMTIFLGIFTFAVTLELPPLVLMSFIIWFYSFFHVHNLVSLPDEEFYAIEDEYLFLSKDTSLDLSILKNYRKVIAGCLIFVGVLLIWNSILDSLYDYIPAYYYSMLREFSHCIPKVVFGIVAIYIGIYMIRGKKAALDQEDEILQDNLSDEEKIPVFPSHPEEKNDSENN